MYKNRCDVPDKYKWDLSDFCKDHETFEKNLIKYNENISKLKDYVGCSKDASKLFEFLKFYLDLYSDIENSYIYAFLKNDEDLGKSSSIDDLNRITMVFSNFELETAFFVPEVLKLSKEDYENLFKENPSLEEYRFYLDIIFRDKDHSLNESEDRIVTELINSMNKYEEMSSTLINSEHHYGKINIDNEKVEIAVNNYRKLTKNKDANIRKKVYNMFNKRLSEYSTTSASLLNAYVSMQNSLAKIHKFPSSWEAKLFGLNLNNKVFETLKNTCESNLDSLHKYYNLRKQVLGLDKQYSYDLNLDLVSSSKKYSIEEAIDLLYKSLSVLGDDYLNHFKKIFDNHYVDFCQYKGKTSGAYSCSSMTNDSRILMSFNDDLDSVSTLAHEGGHNVHHQYCKDNNPIEYRDVSNLVAEVASLTNEFLLSEYIIKNGQTKEEKLHGLDNILGVLTSNFYGAVREGHMEQDMYDTVLNGGTLTKDYLDNLAYKSLKKYYGKEVKLNNYNKNNWITRSHYYMHFYLYNYAICVSVASYVSHQVLDGNQKMLNDYKRFLSLGSNVWPIDAFKVLGIDLENSEVYENTVKYFANKVEEYDKIYNDKDVK